MDRRDKHKRRKIVEEVTTRLAALHGSNPAASVDDAIAELEAMRSVGDDGKPCKACSLPQLSARLSKRDGPKAAAATAAAATVAGNAGAGA